MTKHEQLLKAHEELSKQNQSLQNELVRVKQFQIEFEQYVKEILIKYEEQKGIIVQQNETIQDLKQQTVEIILEKDQLQHMYEQVCMVFKEQQEKLLQEEAMKQLELKQKSSTPANMKEIGVSPIRDEYGVSEEKRDSRSFDAMDEKQNSKKKEKFSMQVASPISVNEEEENEEEEEEESYEESDGNQEETDEGEEETEEEAESKSPSKQKSSPSPHLKTKNVLRELQQDFPGIIKEGEDVLQSEQKLQMFKSKILENLRYVIIYFHTYKNRDDIYL